MFVRVLGGGAVALIVLSPVYMLSTAISELEHDNSEITATLREIQRSRTRLAAQRAERAAAEARYALKAPPLRGFIDEHTSREHITASDWTNEPDRVVGQYTIRSTRVRFQGTGLRAAMIALASIETSRYPVALEMIHIDHRSAGDIYNMQVGVLAFDRQGTPARGADGGVARPATSPSGRPAAGPPAP
jgi:hypothetical protein